MTPLQLKAPDFIPLSEVRSLIGQNLKVDIPQGKITPEGIAEIIAYLKDAYPGVELPSHKDNAFFQWIWLDPKQGTLPKRMAKWLKKRTQRNPEQKVIAEVGNTARRNSDDNQIYYFRIVDKIDWSAEQFGKRGVIKQGGCWWGARGSERQDGLPEYESYADRFEKNEGLGVQFFRSDNYSYDNGIGRLWLHIDQDNRFAATFNGYWDNEGATLRLTRVLASFLGLSYKQCQHLTSNINIYINDNKGYFIGEEQVLNFLKDGSYKIPKKVVYVRCSRCTVAVEENNIYDKMCRICYDLTRKRCLSCFSMVDATRFAQVRTNNGLIEWCANCVLGYAVSCKGCKNAWIQRYFNYPGCIKVDGVYMCAKCTMSARKCQDCGKKTLNTDAMDEPLCLKCEDEFENDIRIPYDAADVTFNITAMSDTMRIATEHATAALSRLRHQLSNNPNLTPEVVGLEDDLPF